MIPSMQQKSGALIDKLIFKRVPIGDNANLKILILSWVFTA